MSEVCTFASGTWEFGTFNYDGRDIYGPVLVCDTHGAPAASEVYDCDPGEEIGLCQPAATYVASHTGFYGQDRIGREARVDERRCRCGRPVDRCPGRAYAADVAAQLGTTAVTVPR